MTRLMLEPFSSALVVESPHHTLDAILRDGGIQVHRNDGVSNEDELIQAIQETNAQIIFKRSRLPVTRRVVEACPSLYAVQLCCIGDDSVDKAACADSGVLVFNDPISNGRSVVELTISHIIALSRRLYETDGQMHQHVWEKNAVGRYEILGKVLGIVGLGNIGRQVARVAEALGMEVRFFDARFVAREVGIEMGWTCCETIEDLFAGSDVVSIHTSAKDPAGDSNAGFLDPYLSKLGTARSKESPRIFINLARGNLHQCDALIDAVQKGFIRRAAVDVYPEEPARTGVPWTNPYANEPRIICTPHIGAATQEAQPRIAQRVAQTVLSFSKFGALRDCVYAPRVKMNLMDQARGHTLLAVVHSVSRGTKKAIDDAIFEAHASNLGSMHRDFDVGVAYDLSVIDRSFSKEELQQLSRRAADISNDPQAIRAIRQLDIGEV